MERNSEADHRDLHPADTLSSEEFTNESGLDVEEDRRVEYAEVLASGVGQFRFDPYRIENRSHEKIHGQHEEETPDDYDDSRLVEVVSGEQEVLSIEGRRGEGVESRGQAHH